MKKKYTFYSDPGHGWLKVSLDEINSLGIADKISPYSYVNNGFVYLEEDCDASTFKTAKQNAGEWGANWQDEVEEKVNGKRMSIIRSYPMYSNPFKGEVA